MSALIENATHSAETFNKNMAQVFTGCMARAVVTNNLGPTLSIEFANVASAKDAPNGIIQNANVHLKFMMHLCDNRGKLLADNSPVEIEILIRPWALREELKFRKIKGKTPADAMQKMFEWFTKNSDIIKPN